MENEAMYDVSTTDKAPYLDVAGTIQRSDGTVTLFVLNRDLSKARQLELNWQDKPATKLSAALVLTGSDLKATNDFVSPTRVVPKQADKPVTNGGRTTIEVPPRSYSLFQWQA
jgi:alpha-N-arabinofuranosidase